MTRRTNIDFFIDDYSNEIVHVDIIYRTKIKKRFNLHKRFTSR